MKYFCLFIIDMVKHRKMPRHFFYIFCTEDCTISYDYSRFKDGRSLFFS